MSRKFTNLSIIRVWEKWKITSDYMKHSSRCQLTIHSLKKIVRWMRLSCVGPSIFSCTERIWRYQQKATWIIMKSSLTSDGGWDLDWVIAPNPPTNWFGFRLSSYELPLKDEQFSITNRIHRIQSDGKLNWLNRVISGTRHQFFTVL